MSNFIQEVLGLLKNRKVLTTIDSQKDYIQLGRKRESSLVVPGYNPQMDPYAIKISDLISSFIILSGTANHIPLFSPSNPNELIDSNIYQDPTYGSVHIYNTAIPTGDTLKYALTIEGANPLQTINSNTILLPNNILLGRPKNTTVTTSLVFGESSSQNLTTGNNVIAIGDGSLFQATNVTDTVSIGNDALFSATNIQQSTVIGSNAGLDITTGGNNILIGYSSGEGITTGGGNTIIGGPHLTPLSSSLTNHILILNGAGDQRITVDDVGRFGLNQATPSAWMDIRGGGSVYPMLSLESSDPVSYIEYTAFPTLGGSQWHVGLSQGGNNGVDNIMYFISDNTSATPDAFSIQRITGNVGIGTYAPDTKLRVVGEAKIGALGYLRLFDGAGGADVRSESGGLYIGTNLADPVDFYTDDIARLRVTGTGQVGIGFGVGSFIHLLDVNGNARVIGHLYDSINNQGTVGQILTKTATGQEWQAPTGGVTGSGTNNYIPLWTGTTSLGDSIASFDSVNNNIDFAGGITTTQDIIVNTVNIGKTASSGLGNYVFSTNSLASITTGAYNIAIGTSNLTGLTTGNYNIAIGVSALENTTAGENVGIGQNAGIATTTGIRNTYLGNGAGATVTTSSSNAFIGFNSGGGQPYASNNTGVGAESLYGALPPVSGVIVRDSNTAIGSRAGFRCATSNNLYLGSSAGFNHNLGGGAVFIAGSSGVLGTNYTNVIKIGDGSGNDRILITAAGQMGLGTAATGTPTDTLHVGGTFRLTGAYYDSTNSAGTSGQLLSSTGTGTQWITASGTGTVTSVDVSGGTTGLTTSGGPITTSGTITLAGTLIAANGGTGQTTYAQGDVLYGNASGGLSKLSPGTVGQVLSTNGAGADPSWIAVGGTGTVTSVDISGGTTGLAFTGGPITTSGTITASGTLDTNNGGTGISAGTLADLQDSLGLKKTFVHFEWTGSTIPYFNVTNGVDTNIPFDTSVTSGNLGTATGFTVTVNGGTTKTTFLCNDTGYYSVTLRLHFFDQFGNLDVVGKISDFTAVLPIKGIIDDKSSETSGDKMFHGTTYLQMTSGTTYEFIVNFSGGTGQNPFPSNANQMVTEVIIESVSLV